MAEANWLTLKYEDFSEFSNFTKTFSSALWCWKMGNRKKSANVTFIRNESICKINSRKMWLNFHLFGLYSEKTLKDTIWFRKVINSESSYFSQLNGAYRFPFWYGEGQTFWQYIIFFLYWFHFLICILSSITVLVQNFLFGSFKMNLVVTLAEIVKNRYLFFVHKH